MSVYASSFATTAGAPLLHSPTRLAAARRMLEGNSEWAELTKLQHDLAAQEVCCVCKHAVRHMMHQSAGAMRPGPTLAPRTPA